MTSACVDENTIQALLAGKLPTEQATAVQHHLDRCSDCADLVARVAAAAPRTVGGSTPQGTHETPTVAMSTAYVQEVTGYIDERIRQPEAGWLLSRGEMVDQFSVIGPLGRGGMGEVYLARDTELKRKVALKMVREEVVDKDQGIDRFLFEAQATARFSHPHIVTIHAVGRHRGKPYLALEYVEGQNLQQTLRLRRPDLKEVVAIGQAIVAALQEAHAHRILHRDLKPANVLLAKDGRVRVLDFGLARVTTADDAPPSNEPRKESSVVVEWGQLSEKTIRGTPAYLAPEQWRGEQSVPATDIWALGLILAELVTGRRPYAGQSIKALRENVSSNQPAPLALPPDPSVELDDLIRRCLAKRHERRPSAAEAGNILQEVSNRLLISELTDLSTLSGIATAVPQRRWWPVVALIALIFLIGIGGLWLSRLSPQVSPRSPSPAPHRPAPGPLAGPTHIAADAGIADARTLAGTIQDATDRARAGQQVAQQISRKVGKRRRRAAQRRQKPTHLRAEPAVYGKLFIHSQTEDGRDQWARIFVDGRYHGDTPKTIQGLSVGRHRVRVEHPGFVTAMKTVVIKQGKKAVLSFTLTRK